MLDHKYQRNTFRLSSNFFSCFVFIQFSPHCPDTHGQSKLFYGSCDLPSLFFLCIFPSKHEDSGCHADMRVCTSKNPENFNEHHHRFATATVSYLLPHPTPHTPWQLGCLLLLFTAHTQPPLSHVLLEKEINNVPIFFLPF